VCREQTIRAGEAAVSQFDLVHAAVDSAAERMTVPELPVDPESESIICIRGTVLGPGHADKERHYQ
jgi:hypothetical protein